MKASRFTAGEMAPTTYALQGGLNFVPTTWPNFTIHWNQVTPLSTRRLVGGGGGTPQGILDGGMPPGYPNLLTFQTKNVIFHFRFQTWPLRNYVIITDILSCYWLTATQMFSLNPFRISMFLFPWNLSEIETINTFIHSRSSPENQTRFQT